MKSNNFIVVHTISRTSDGYGACRDHLTNVNRAPSGFFNNGAGMKIENSEHFLGQTQKKVEDEVPRKDDLFKCMKGFLIFGKLIGLVPISGLLSRDAKDLKFRLCSISSVLSLFIISILSCNTGIAIIGFFQEGGQDAAQLFKNAAGSVCYSVGLYVFIFMFRNAQKLVELLQKWKELDSVDHVDNRLQFCIILIAGIILSSAITENAVSHLLLFPLNERVAHPLEYYYVNSHKQWASLIPYNAMIAVAVFFCNKWAVYAWNFGDILIAIVSRALYGKFKGFGRNVEERLMLKDAGRSVWSKAIQEHERIARLAEEFGDLLSPLVFISFAVNIYFICIQLHHFLVPSKKLDFISTIYLSWSFLHLILRTFTVVLTAAKIHDYAQHFLKLLAQCPKEFYTLEVERAERNITNFPTLFHGLGAFRIERPFFLSVISVIFTFEIVLLQTSQMVQPSKN